MSEKDAEKLNFYHSYIYDSPDGQDCARKAFHMAKITGFAGSFTPGSPLQGCACC